MNHLNKALKQLLFLVFLFSYSFSAFAEEPHRLVIQVSSNDQQTQTMVLGNIVNLQKHYGMDNIEIEVVAYGPGLEMLTTKSSLASRITSLIFQDVRFSACLNTMDQIKKKTGQSPALSEGVETVRAGVARILELQEEGYSYVRP